jgi:hypothetical protein
MLAVLVLVVAALVLFMFIIDDWSDLATYLTRLVMSTIAAAALISSFTRIAELSGQHARDLRAASIFAAVAEGAPPPRPYTLYLRPFASTDRFAEEVLSAAGASLAAGQGLLYAGAARVELEAQLEQATRPLGELVALGQPLEHIGAGRVLVDEDKWQDAVQALTRFAELIVILPSSRPGTLWEIERLLDGNLIPRTVLIDAPNSQQRAKDGFAQNREWAQVREAFAARGYEMPEDSPAGVLLYFGTEKTPQVRARLDIDAEHNIRRFFKRVLTLRPA